ncbi:MAG: serine/threonine protein kinase [Gemmatimonadota bacterium]|nr:MAG: serine/threonine protein kinase [Gemmatimonadota bacterium]
MPNEDLSGRTIAGYKLVSRVGEGGTATVYRAEHPDHGRCAVKILKQRTRSDPTAVKRFLREAGYGARVEHSAVVCTYDYGEEDGIDYLALEWVDGEPLSQFVNRSGPLAPPLVAHIVRQLADGLNAAHSVGIIHRDLKPENIVYDPSSRTAKLLDFGIARDAQEPASERLTRTGFFVGTLQYVAPEALSGELVGEKADIFSLAKITYFLLTGVHPHPGRSPREVFHQLLTQPPIPLNQAVRDLRFPAELEVAVMKGLQRQPDDRHASVVEFAEHVARGVDAVDEPPRDRGFLGAIKSLVRDRRGKGGE